MLKWFMAGVTLVLLTALIQKRWRLGSMNSVRQRVENQQRKRTVQQQHYHSIITHLEDRASQLNDRLHSGKMRNRWLDKLIVIHRQIQETLEPTEDGPARTEAENIAGDSEHNNGRTDHFMESVTIQHSVDSKSSNHAANADANRNRAQTHDPCPQRVSGAHQSSNKQNPIAEDRDQ